jgi:hypothetical protein
VKPASKGGRYAWFLGFSAGIAAALCAVGYAPTRHLAGDAGVAGMLGGCAAGLISAALAGGLLVAVEAPTPEARMQRGFMAMTVRVAAVAALGAAAVFRGEFSRQPLLFWIGASYVALLPLEVRLAIL